MPASGPRPAPSATNQPMRQTAAISHLQTWHIAFKNSCLAQQGKIGKRVRGVWEATTVGVVARDRANNAGESNIRPPRCCGLSIVVQKKRMPRGGVLHTIQNSSSSIAAISAEQSTRPQADRHWVDGKAGQEPAHVKSNGREAHEKFCCERCAGVGRGPVREWDRCCRGPGWSPSAPVEFIVPARRSAVAWLAKFLRRHNIFVRNPGRLRHIGEISLVYWHIIYQTPPSCPV